MGFKNTTICYLQVTYFKYKVIKVKRTQKNRIKKDVPYKYKQKKLAKLLLGKISFQIS